jgi:antitoxin VapB
MNTVAEQSPPYFTAPTSPPTEPPARFVRLFRNGANQALRIPKEFELPGKEAELRQVGNTLVITPIKPHFEKGSPQSLAALLDELAKLGSCDDFPDVDESLLALDDIDLSNP